jgi:hypothetical protein
MRRLCEVVPLIPTGGISAALRPALATILSSEMVPGCCPRIYAPAFRYTSDMDAKTGWRIAPILRLPRARVYYARVPMLWRTSVLSSQSLRGHLSGLKVGTLPRQRWRPHYFWFDRGPDAGIIRNKPPTPLRFYCTVLGIPTPRRY